MQLQCRPRDDASICIDLGCLQSVDLVRYGDPGATFVVSATLLTDGVRHVLPSVLSGRECCVVRCAGWPDELLFCRERHWNLSRSPNTSTTIFKGSNAREIGRKLAIRQLESAD